MLAEQFAPLDIECLVKTAVELWNGIDEADLSRRQRTVLDQAAAALHAEAEGALPPPSTGSVVRRAPSTRHVWVLQRWERRGEEITLWADRSAAVACLAEHVRTSWDNLADRDALPDRAPTSDRQAVDLYYSVEAGREEEGYALYPELLGTSGRSRISPRPLNFPSTAACELANQTAVFHPQREAGTRPCLEVAGIQVYAYLDATDRLVQVSVHLDTTDDALVRPDGTVPLRITVGDSDILDCAQAEQHPDGAPDTTG